MAISLSSITKGVAVKAPRIVLIGVEGVGKSTFAAAAPGSVIIPMRDERGVDQIDAAKFPAVNSYAELIEALGVLYKEQHDYSTVVIDSASALQPMIWAAVCEAAGAKKIEEVGGGYGKGYTYALDLWRDLTQALDALRDDKGIGSILIGHVVTSEFADPEADPYTTYEWDIHKKAAAQLYRWADAVLFANYEKAAVVANDAGFNKKTRRAAGTGKRALYTEKRPAHPGKNRYGLPYKLPLDWAAFHAAMSPTAEATA
jgi:hypothetical protein